MERLTNLLGQILPTLVADVTPDRCISMDELKKHNADSDDPWLLIKGKVYAVKEFLDEHPGGDAVLKAYAGVDCTEQFEAVSHSEIADEIMEEDLIVGVFQ